MKCRAGILGLLFIGISVVGYAEGAGLATCNVQGLGYGAVLTSSWSPEGRYLATGSEGGAVLLWDMQCADFASAPTVSLVHQYSNDITALAWSPNGQFLVVGSGEGLLEIWRMAADSGNQLEKQLISPSCAGKTVWALAWSPDSTLLATGTGIRDGYACISEVLVWDVDPQSERYGLERARLCDETQYQVFSLSWSSDGSRLAAGCGVKEKVQIADSTSPFLGYGSGKLMVWDVDTQSDSFGATLLSSEQNGAGFSHENIFSVAWSPDGNYLAAGMGKLEEVSEGEDYIIWASRGGCMVWDMNPDSVTFETVIHALYQPTSSVSWSPNGRYLATGFYAPSGSDSSGYASELAAVTVLDARPQSATFGDIVQSTAGSNLKNAYCAPFSPVANAIAIASDASLAHWTLEDLPEVRTHSADTQPVGVPDQKISLHELLRVIQLFNAGAYQCSDEKTEDNYALGMREDNSCTPHDSDYAPQNWWIEISELLRIIQLYNAGGYRDCSQENTPHEADGYCLL